MLQYILTLEVLAVVSLFLHHFSLFTKHEFGIIPTKEFREPYLQEWESV